MVNGQLVAVDESGNLIAGKKNGEAKASSIPAVKQSPKYNISHNKPIVAHVVTWLLSVGGIQRMMADWSKDKSVTHILFAYEDDPHIFNYGDMRVFTNQKDDTVIRQIRPDVLIHHGPQSHVCHYTECPVIWFIHGESVFQSPMPTWCNPVAIMANTKPAQMDESWRNSDITVIPLGVDLDLFAPKPRRLVAGIVGRISPEKIPPSFIDWLERQQNKDWTFRFIGIGISMQYQKTTVERLRKIANVEVMGDIHGDDMPSEYNRLDAVLIPSDTETGSYAAAEALACGLPIVCRDLPALRETCEDAAIYWKSYKDMVVALDYLRKPKNRLRMSEDARSKAIELHNLNDAHKIRRSIIHKNYKPQVSILVPSFNPNPLWLREMYDSVCEQSVKWEMVIVDDGSEKSDYSLFDDDFRVKVIKSKHRGISATLNDGYNVCECDLIARIDTDDKMTPDRLEKQLAYMLANPDVAVLGGQLEMMRDGKMVPGSTTRHPAIVSKDDLPQEWRINHPSVMMRRSLIGKSPYDESLKTAEDCDLWARLARKDLPIHNLPDTILIYRVHDKQVTRTETFAKEKAIVFRRYAHAHS